MTPKRPFERPYRQQHGDVKKWLDEEYPAIQNRAKEENAEIYWKVETRLCTEDQHEDDGTLNGVTTRVQLSDIEKPINMISAINNQGKVKFMLFEGDMKPYLLVDFMKRLVRNSNRKVILLLVRYSAPYNIKVMKWKRDKKPKIQMYFYPSLI